MQFIKRLAQNNLKVYSRRFGSEHLQIHENKHKVIPPGGVMSKSLFVGVGLGLIASYLFFSHQSETRKQLELAQEELERLRLSQLYNDSIKK
jgi:hypothetical protein